MMAGRTTVAITELEFRKAADVFDTADGMHCIEAPTEETKLAEFIQKTNAHHAVVGLAPYRDQLYRALPRGAVIARFGVGHDNIDKSLAAENGLLCTNTPDMLTESVAE